MALTRITKGVIKPNENYDTHNINSTGIITATRFVGPVTGAITGTADLASGLTGTPDIAVRNITGVGATFTGNVSIGGTLTYEDVTSIDSVGIITARDHIHIKADNKQLKIGAHNDGDMLSYHDGNKSVIVNYTGDFHIRSNNGSRASKEGIILKPNGATEIYHSGNKKLETSSTGATLTGTMNIANGAGQSHYQITQASGNTVKFGIVSGSDIELSGSSNNSMYFKTNNTERLRIASNGQVSISNDGTTDGLLTIKGNSDQVGTPSIRLLDGSDTREVSITNTSGDFVASVHGNDNAIHGHIKMFESGIFSVANGGASGSNVARLTITAAGLVGINRTSPNHTLEVGGNVYITSNTTNANEGGGLLFQAKGGGFNSTSCAAIKGLRTSDTSSYLVFETGGTTERLRITSDGKYYFTGTGGGSGSRGLGIETESVGAVDEGVILNARASGTTGRIKFQTNSATAMTILGNGGNVLIGGHTTSIEPDNYESHLQVHGTATDAGISILRYSNNSGGPTLLFGKSRGASIGAIGEVQSGDSLGKIEFYGTDTGWESSASIRASADGEWYSGSSGSEDNTDAPGRLEFHTTPDGSDNMQERLRITSGGKVNIGGNYTQTSAPLSVTTSANAYGIRLMTGSNVVTEILNNDSAGNSEIRGYYNNNSGTRGEGYRLEANGDTFFNPGGVTGLIIRSGNGYVGAGKGTPGCALDVLNTADQLVARFLSSHNSLGGGVQVKNNNARGGLEFLNTSGTNVGAFYHSTGGWTWDKELQLVGSGAKLRIGTTSGSYLLNVDTNDGTDGHIMASFNGQESSNHAGLMIAHYLCGSDDNRTGLYWEHQNVSNERMWMGDDKRLYLKNSNPTESTAQGRYLMTVEGGTADFPNGSSYDNAAKSALEIKKHYPNSQSGNYWIFDHNNVPRQIYCDMEVDGGGWMLWNKYNVSMTSMNEALGGSPTSPHSGLSRSNWGNYSKYQLLIRASDIDHNGERLHSIVQLDANGALLRCADYGADFFLEDVGDQFQPNLTHYFDSATGEYIKINGAYQPQLGANNWQTFSNGGWQVVYIREMDSRMSPGMHRTYAMVDRVYGFDTNGVPVWYQTEDMSPLPFFGDIILSNEVADGTNAFMSENNRRLTANNGNNGPYAMGRMRGVFTGQFECEFKLGYSWGWSQAIAMSTIQMEALHKEPSGNPYNPFATNKGQLVNSGNPYAYFGIRNNNSNNLWDVFMSSTFNGGQTISTNSGGAAFSVGHVIWRESDGTIKARRKDGTHGTKTMSHKFAGPLVFVSGQQSVMDTEWVSCWDAKDDGTHVGNRTRYGI